MDASKILALILGVALAGVARQWWAGFVAREEAKPIELVEVDGRMVPKPSRLDRIRRIFDIIVIAWLVIIAAMLAVWFFVDPFGQ